MSSPFVHVLDIYTPGNTRYDNYRAQLVKIGDAIQSLADNGVRHPIRSVPMR